MFRMLCKETAGEVLSLDHFPSRGLERLVVWQCWPGSHLGLCSMRYGENFAWNHKVEPGRVVEAFLPASGGIVLYSVYLHDGEGLDERNQGILHLIGERIRAHQLPVIVAGDFNCPVIVLQESGWMRRLQLHVLQPDTHVPTFVTRNGVSYNDFVLVSSSQLARCKGTFVKLDSGLHGHGPVCFNFAHRGPMPKYRALVKGATIHLAESTLAKRSLQTLSPSLKECRWQRNMCLVRGTKKP